MSYEETPAPELFPPPPQCAYHPDRAAVGYCSQCGQPTCAECFLPHGDRRLCPVCVVSAPKPPPNTPALVFGIIAGALFLCLVALLIVYGVTVRRARATEPASQLAEGPTSDYGLTAPAMQLTPPAMELPGTSGIPLTAPGYMTPNLPPYGGGMPPMMPPMPPLTPPAAAPAPPPPPAPSSAGAISAALAGRPGWVGKVVSHSPDWKQVVVHVGPSQKDLRVARELVWVGGTNSFDILSEGPVQKAAPQPATPPSSSGGATLAPAPKPSESAAKRAALADEPPGYQAKVISHSADWREVTIQTGPPQGPPSTMLRFHWDPGLKDYVLNYAGPPGQTPPPPPDD